jgi:hypothetical protein
MLGFTLFFALANTTNEQRSCLITKLSSKVFHFLLFLLNLDACFVDHPHKMLRLGPPRTVPTSTH